MRCSFMKMVFMYRFVRVEILVARTRPWIRSNLDPETSSG